MSLYTKIAGIVGTFFQIGGPAGPGFNDTSSGVITATTSNGSTLANVRVATPANDNDAATKAYVDEAFKPLIVTAQSNAASALIACTSTEHYIVVSTAGTGAAAAYIAGTVLWDDGLNGAGNTDVVIIGPTVGGEITVTTALTGGTFTFVANTNYVWTGSTWISAAANTGGVNYTIQQTIGTSSSYSSATTVPANAVIVDVTLNVTTAYSAGTTISIGQTGSTSLLMGTGDNTATTIDQYANWAVTAWGSSALAVLVTIAGSPSVGAGTVTTTYCLPLS